MNLTGYEWSVMGYSLLIAGSATVLAILPALLAGQLFARHTFPGKALLETLLMMPLVVPPVVIGYGLLILFGRNTSLGTWLHGIGIPILFAPAGMILASAIVAFPLIFRSMRAALEQTDPHLEHHARTLGCNRLRAWTDVTLPLAWPGLVSGILLGFARALGEFGATRMVATNLPGQRTLALEIFHQFEVPGSDLGAVAGLVLLSVFLSGILLFTGDHLTRAWKRRQS
ncbi:MAG: molybdate ABC transporter permease subunit [Kiritimatiellae bacterium]|nr:molybdate ABC transporter permease subunit [Kiritimatiellia bacterium]